RAHEGLANVLITLIDDLNFDTVLEGEQAVKRTGALVRELIGKPLLNSPNALETEVQTRLIASPVSAGAVAMSADPLKSIVELCSYSDNTLMRAAQSIENEGIRKDIDALLELGQRSHGVFTMRQQELNATAGASRVINENQKIQ